MLSELKEIVIKYPILLNDVETLYTITGNVDATEAIASLSRSGCGMSFMKNSI